MVAVSNVPGRLRLKNSVLLGQPVLCRRVEAAVLEVPGVWYAEASHRTGTLLLVHDARAAGESVIEEARRSLEACWSAPLSAGTSAPITAERAVIREATKELAWHGLRMMLPPPLGTLLPVVPIARQLLAAQRATAARNGGHRNGHVRSAR